jgi:hypothetical protein
MMAAIPSAVVVCHLVVAGTCHFASEATALGHFVANEDTSFGGESGVASSDAVEVA